MKLLADILRIIARHGRLVLVGGLIVGIFLPQLAHFLQAYIPEAVAIMLFVVALRIGPQGALGRLGQMRTVLLAVTLYQVIVPCLFVLTFMAFGLTGALASAIILAAAASPISGSPNLVLLTGNDPVPALRLLILGTALLPITIIPVFTLAPEFGDLSAVMMSSLRLVALIGGATVGAFAVRRLFLPRPSPQTLQIMDGLSVLIMALVVIGLMANFGPALVGEPVRLAETLAVAFLFNFGLQIVCFISAGKIGLKRDAAAYGITAGNRNIMIFLAALPQGVIEPMLLFVACYQVPMYLTPLLLGTFYKSSQRAS